MTFPIRNYHPRDAAYLAVIFYNSVRQVGCRHYNASQVEARPVLRTHMMEGALSSQERKVAIAGASGRDFSRVSQ